MLPQHLIEHLVRFFEIDIPIWTKCLRTIASNIAIIAERMPEHRSIRSNPSTPDTASGNLDE